jgi:hypothetical protein
MRAVEFITEAFDRPYKSKWEKTDYGDVDVLAKLPDGSPLSIMFNQQQGDHGEEVVQVEFYRNNSQEVTGEGDAQRIFATVLSAIQKYIKKYKPSRLSFSASKATDPTIYYEPDQPQPNPESRAKLYDRLVQRYAKAWGYRAFRADTGDLVIYELSRLQPAVAESFIRNGADWGDALRELNVFNDVFLSPDIQDTHEYTRDPEWQELAKMIRNSAKVQEIYGQLKKFANLGVKLTSPEVERLDSLVWDGGGGMDIDRLKDLYAHQLGAVGALLKTQAPAQNKTKSGQTIHEQGVEENFADGKVKGKSRPGRVKRAGASCDGSVTDLRARAKRASGEKAKMYHWCANMKSGKKK